MRKVSEITGFSPTLLRAWERRYDFLQPDRLPGGHRVYDDSDLAVLLQVKKLLSLGQSIGRAAALGREQLLHRSGPETVALREAHELASNELEVFRTTRYRGDDLGVSIRSLDPQSLGVVVALYERVKGIYEVWLYTEGHTESFSVLEAQVNKLYSSDLMTAVARIDTSAYPSDSLLRAALEDTKWGALGPLSRLYKSPDRLNEETLRTIVLLCRDHAKLMRNAFYDLDQDLRAADGSSKAHGASGAVKKVQEVCPEIEAHLDWEGCYSSLCLETSAVDRVLYDFVRRISDSDTGSALLWVGAVNDSLLRWAFHTDSKNFRAHRPEDLATLAVARSVGVSGKAALEMGYLGSEKGWAWFHWPSFEPAAGTAICECELD